MDIIIKEYVIEKLRSLAEAFPGMIFKMGESVYSGNVFVEVTPEELYNSEAYILAEAAIVQDFTSISNEITLTFFNNDPHIQINKDVMVITKHKSNNSLSQIGVSVSTKDIPIQLNTVAYQLLSNLTSEESYALAA